MGNFNPEQQARSDALVVAGRIVNGGGPFAAGGLKGGAELDAILLLADYIVEGYAETEQDGVLYDEAQGLGDLLDVLGPLGHVAFVHVPERPKEGDSGNKYQDERDDSYDGEIAESESFTESVPQEAESTRTLFVPTQYPQDSAPYDPPAKVDPLEKDKRQYPRVRPIKDQPQA